MWHRELQEEGSVERWLPLKLIVRKRIRYRRKWYPLSHYTYPSIKKKTQKLLALLLLSSASCLRKSTSTKTHKAVKQCGKQQTKEKGQKMGSIVRQRRRGASEVRPMERLHTQRERGRDVRD